MQITVKEKIQKIMSFWRFFAGMIIGGFCGILAFIMDGLIKHGKAYISQNDSYLWFFIGACGIGLVMGAIFQDSKNKKTQANKDNKLYFNGEYIVINDNGTKQQRESIKKSKYKNEGIILHYADELTPSQRKEIEKRDSEISEIKKIIAS